MKLLTAKEVKTINASKQFEGTIARIIDANLKALRDFIENKGYQNTYTSKAEEVAYDLGWNKMAKLFPYR